MERDYDSILNPTQVFFLPLFLPPFFNLPICTMPPRLDESSKAVKTLRKRFASGQYNEEDDARSVQASEPLFHEFKIDTFRTRFNRLRKEYCGVGRFFCHLLFFSLIFYSC